MKKTTKIKEISPYSQESIAIKLNILYFSLLLLKILILAPFIFMILRYLTASKLFISIGFNGFLIKIGSLIFSILLSLISTKKEIIKNPLFLDDNIVISNKKKSNGAYENIYTNKFKILLGFNIACIIPLCFIISLTISSLICLIIKLFSLSYSINLIIKYFLTLILLSSLSKSFNEPLIKYLRNKQD